MSCSRNMYNLINDETVLIIDENKFSSQSNEIQKTMRTLLYKKTRFVSKCITLITHFWVCINNQNQFTGLYN